MTRRLWLLPLLVLLVGLGGTYAAWTLARQDIQRAQQEKFDFRVDEITDNILSRLQSYEQMLLGVSGLFAASASVERAEFRAYVDKLRVTQKFPGIQGVGFAQLVSASGKARFVEQIRKEGFPDFTLRPESVRDPYTAIIYLEPFDWRNRRAFGFDMYSEAVRHAAMRTAWEEGGTAMSGKVTLVQETGKDVQFGFLMYVPVYRNKASVDSVNARRASLLGWSYAPFRMNDLMKGILGKQFGEIQAAINLEIYDGDNVRLESMMYDSHAVAERKESGYGVFHASRKIEFGKHRWTILVRSLPEFDANEARSRLGSIGFAGVTISMLIALTAWLLLTGRARAMALAQSMAAKLGESESRSHAVLENVLDGIITIDGMGAVTSFNRAAERIFGYGADEVIGCNIKMLMPEPYYGEHDGYLHNYRTSGIKKIIGIGREVTGRRKDGSTFPMELAVSEFLLSRERLFTGIVRDITERKQAEAKLEALHGEMRRLLESTGEGIYGMDAQGRCTFINSAAARMLDYEVAEMLGKNMHTLIHHSHFDGSPYAVEDCPIFQALHAGRPRRVESEVFWRKNQKPLPVEYASYPIMDTGKITGAVITFADITQRLKAMREISRFKNVLDNTLDMIFMFDPETFRFVYLNKGTVAALGYSREELLDRQVWEIKPHMPEHVFRSHIAPLLNGERPWLNYETVHRCKDGCELPVEVFLQLVEEGEGKRLFVAISRDLTERRKVDKMKSEFISTVSHELRTPLTSIRGALGLVRGGVAGELPAQARPMIDIAYNNAERLVRLINDILDIEKIESGKMHFDMKETELMPLVEQALEANRAYGGQYQVRFTLAASAPGAKVKVDTDRLAQVLANLLSNAAKFSPPEDEVTVSVHPLGNMIRIAVSDHGAGIPEEFRSRIFQKFSQADSSDTKKKGGTGLGLSITKAIVEKMDGQIGFDSAPGLGATFYVDLPDAAPNPGVSPSPRILICENDSETAAQLRGMMERRGYQVDVAGSAAEAKRLLAVQHYHAMTLDVALPGQDGVSLVQELKSDEKTAGLPILLISAKASAEREPTGSGLEVLDGIDQPLSPDRVFAALRERTGNVVGVPVILHVEDDPDIRQVMKALLGDRGEVIAAPSLAAAGKLLEERHFDLLILDIGLPDGSGLDMLALAADKKLAVPVLIFSAHELDRNVTSAVDAALVKSKTSNQHLLETIMSVIARHDRKAK